MHCERGGLAIETDVGTRKGIRAYGNGQINAVAQMDSLQTAVVVAHGEAGSITAGPAAVVGLSKRQHAGVRDVGTLDESDALQFGQARQLCDRVVSKKRAASEVNVAYTVARVDQALDTDVGNMTTVPQMHVVEVAAKPGNGVDSRVRHVAALG